MNESSAGAGSNVFTYGSLMFDAVWDRVVRGRYRSTPATLHGYRRFAVRGQTYPAVVAEPGGVVDGRLWLDVSAADLARLDAFEEGYVRDDVDVLAGGSPVRAPVYAFDDRSRVEDRDWDPERFAREHAQGFAEIHLAAVSGGR